MALNSLNDSVVSLVDANSKLRIQGESFTGLAVIDVSFAVPPGKTWFTVTVIAAQSVLAGCSIETRTFHTFLYVHFTCLSLEG